MANNRDNFTKPVRDNLQKRVGGLCSNPDCQTLTTGPHTNKKKITDMGIAAHITAASIGGPRYKSSLTTEQRKDISNGIWLCVVCSNIIDKDPDKYSVNLLNGWKEKAEAFALDVISSKASHMPPVILKTLETKIKELEENPNPYPNDLYTKDKDGHNFYSRDMLIGTVGKVAKYICDHEVNFFETKNTSIADTLNILPETLARVLKKFENKELINKEKKIIDRIKLESFFEEFTKAMHLMR